METLVGHMTTSQTQAAVSSPVYFTAATSGVLYDAADL